TYLGTTTANGSGNWSMAFAAVNKDTITATASEANTTTAHNTSEFAVCALCATLAPTVSGPQTPCVNATGVKYFISGGSATSNFVWTVPSGATQTAGVTSDTVYVSFGSTSGNLSVTETDLNNCSGSANYAITLAPIPATPTISAGGPTTFCIPGNVTLTASSSTSGVSFQWYESAATIGGATNTTYQTNASGSYTVVASKGGCSSPASAATAVTANPAVTANATGTAGGVCAGSSINLQANASGGSGLYNYSWTASGSSFTSNQANPSTNAPSSSTFYIVSVTDQANANCSVVDSVTITVVSVSVDAGGGPLGQQKLCAGENFLIDSDTSGGVGPYTFTWTAAVPADLAYLSNTSILHPTVTPTANGSFKYYLSVHDAGSTCADVMDSITIIMNPLPMSQISSSDTLVCAGADAVLVAQITIQTAGPYTYTWSETFGLLADSITTTTEPTFTINPTKDSASFCVEVTDVNGCISPCTEVPIKALNTQVLVVPNLMTPNNDNLNDCFIIRDINNRDILPGSSFEVYNRWGEAVHKAEDYTNKRPWCGNALNDGMYYYHIKTGCGKKDLRGWLQVIGSEAKNH
ncbi:MAG: gliding motility-associated C-terminal domain-containing protein, partial [Cytophagaceae bacterium]